MDGADAMARGVPADADSKGNRSHRGVLPQTQPVQEESIARTMRLTEFPSALANRPLRQRRGRSALVRHGIRALAIIFVILVVAFGAAAAVILSGPTEFTVVRDRIQAVLQANLGKSYAVSVGHALIDVDPVLGLVVRVDDIEVRDSENAVVTHVPSTRLAIDPLSLLRLRVEISNIELSGADISFVRADDGEVYLGNSGTAHAVARANPKAPPSPGQAGADGGFPDLLAAMQILDSGIEPPIEAATRAGFKHLSIVNGSIDVWDAQRLQQRRFTGTDLGVSVDPVTSGLSLNFATSGFDGRWTATLERDVDKTTGGRSMSAVFSQLTLADVFPGIGDDTGFLVADVPLYGRATVHFAKDGGVEDAMVRLDLGAGTFRFGESRETILLDEATIKLRWDVPNKVLVVEPSTFFFGDTRGVVTGAIRLEGDPSAHRYAFDLDSQGTVLAPRDSPEPPLVVQRITVSGIADLPAKLFSVSNATILTQDASVVGAGSIGYDGPTPSVAIAAAFSPMDVSALKQLWVPFIAPGARHWVLQHVRDGRITTGQLQAAIPAGLLWNGKRTPIPEDDLRLDFHLENVTVDTFGSLPPISKATGNAVLAGSTFGVDLESGEVKVPSGATVAVTAGAFAIANTAPKVAEGVIEVQLAGDAGPLAEIANAKPLLALDRRQMQPSDLSGKGEASVSVRLPLRAGITEADVDWKVVVNATDLASSAPVEDRMVSAATVTITATPDDVTVKGKAKFDGMPADVSMVEPIGAAKGGPGERQVRLLLDDAARKRLGIGLGNVLAGTVGATVSNVSDGGKGQHYALDLKKARLMLPGLGWTKGIGVAGTLSFDLTPVDGGFTATNIVLDGDGFGFTGSAKLDANHGLVSADINDFSLHKGDSIAFKLTRVKSGYAITARGAAFDVRGVIGHIRNNNEASDDSPDLTVDAHIDRLTGFNQETVNGSALSFVSVGGETQKVSFAGTVGGGEVSISYDDSGHGATLAANSDDAGRVMRFLDLYTRFSGGTLKIVGQRNSSTSPMNGSLTVDNFRVLNEPAMQKVVSSNTPSPEGGTTGFDANSVHFDKMIANFRKTDQSLSIEDALLRGPAVGATFSGRYNLDTTEVSILGTYLPNYNFNNAFSRIPVIGLMLSGGFREGLIGVTFKIEGTLSSPKLFYNPLSAVAPGIFRKIFEFQQPIQVQ